MQQFNINQKRALRKWFKQYNKKEYIIMKSEKKATNNDIDEELYKLILTNPFIVTPVPFTKAKQLSISHNPINEYYGQLNRYIWCLKNGKKYDPDGNYTENYQSYIGYIPEPNQLKFFFDPSNELYLKQFNLQYDYTYNKITNEPSYIIGDKFVFESENFVSHYLVSDTIINDSFQLIDKSYILDKIKINGLEPSDELIDTIMMGLNNKVSMINGAGGTGKTEAIKLIIRTCIDLKIHYHVVSFTGKSIDNLGRRLEEHERNNITTIHSFLYKLKNDLIVYNNEFLLIVEEVSMVPTSLFSKLLYYLKKKNYNVQIIMVGDENQLPPIGWGNLMENIIYSKKIPLMTLEKNYRMQKESGKIILGNSSFFKKNNQLSYNLNWDQNIFILGNDDIDEYIKLYDSNIDMIIITPWRKRANDINSRAQQLLRIHDDKIVYTMGRMSYQWCVYDKIIFNTNFKDKEIYNGTDGMIIRILPSMVFKIPKSNEHHKYSILLPDKSIKVVESNITRDIDVDAMGLTIRVGVDKMINVPIIHQWSSDEDKYVSEILLANHLDLAYAITTHKFQGSEKNVIVYDCRGMSLDYIPGGKCNIYTALTRAKEKIYYLGSPGLLYYASISQYIPSIDRLSHLLSKEK